MANRTKTGQKGERAVAQTLNKRGFKTKLSPGSRGPADVTARKGGTKLAIQVKSSEGGKPKNPSPREKTRLGAMANATGAVPVVAQVTFPRKTKRVAKRASTSRKPAAKTRSK